MNITSLQLLIEDLQVESLVMFQFLNDLIQDESKPPQKNLYELRIKFLEEIDWPHLAEYERKWLLVRFPSSTPPF